MKFEKVIKTVYKTTKGEVDKISKKSKKIIKAQDGGIADQGPTGLTGSVKDLKKGKKK